MSEIQGTEVEHKICARSLLILTIIYTVVFAFVFHRYAYAEPGGFPVFYTSGKLARFDLQGLYNQHLQDIFHPQNQGVGYFFHLPYEAVLLVPLSYLPQIPAYAVWTLLNLACLFGGALILRKHFPAFQLLVPFAFAPTLSLLLNGQDLGIATLLVIAAFDSFVAAKDIRAGLLLSLGLFKFPLVIPLAAIIGLRYWRVLTGFIAGSVPLLLLSASVLGRRGIQDYFSLTMGTDAKEYPAILVNLRGMFGEFSGPHTYLVIVASIIVVVIAATIRAARIPTFCIAVITTVLVSWHAHLYDALLLLIPMAWMYGDDSMWVRQTPNVLILLTISILPNPMHGYWLGIFLCVLFLVIVTRSFLKPALIQ